MHVEFTLPQEDLKRTQKGILEQLKEHVRGLCDDHWKRHTRYLNISG